MSDQLTPGERIRQMEYDWMVQDTLAREKYAAEVDRINREHWEAVASINQAFEAGQRRADVIYWLQIAAVWLVFFPLVSTIPFWLPVAILFLLGK